MRGKRFSLGILSEWAAWVGAGVFTAALAFFASIGSYSRLWADDYCYSALIKQHGWLGGVKMWFLTSGNRFSSAGTVGLIDVFGPRAISFLPMLLLVAWAAAWFAFLDQVRQLFLPQLERRWMLLLSLVQVYFVTLLSPDRLQVIYWRMGLLHYSFPLPLLLLHLGWSAGYFRRVFLTGAPVHLNHWVLLVSGLWTFYNAGHSETAAFMQAGIYGVLLFTCWVLLKGSQRVGALKLAGASLAGTGVGILVMFLSPSNSDRLVGMASPDNLWLIIPHAFRYVLDFIFFSIRGQVTPYVVYFFACAAISLLMLIQAKSSFSPRSIVVGLLLAAFLTILFIAFSFAPSAYANLQYPGKRALMPGCFLLLAGLGTGAFFISAAWLRLLFRVPTAWLRLAALFFLLSASIYPAYAVKNLLSEREDLAVWAARWDDRDQQIRLSATAGILDVQVKQIEVVRSLEDMDPYSYHWINHCAAIYYGVQTITANP
jgi:hypothetical protein